MKTKWNVTVIKNEYVENLVKIGKKYQILPHAKVKRFKKNKTVNIENKKIKKGE